MIAPRTAKLDQGIKRDGPAFLTLAVNAFYAFEFFKFALGDLGDDGLDLEYMAQGASGNPWANSGKARGADLDAYCRLVSAAGAAFAGIKRPHVRIIGEAVAHDVSRVV
jgi:hypothetical protein